MVMYCQFNFLEVMYWYWYYIFGDVMSNVMQYFSKVMFKALETHADSRYQAAAAAAAAFLTLLCRNNCGGGRFFFVRLGGSCYLCLVGLLPFFQ